MRRAEISPIHRRKLQKDDRFDQLENSVDFASESACASPTNTSPKKAPSCKSCFAEAHDTSAWDPKKQRGQIRQAQEATMEMSRPASTNRTLPELLQKHSTTSKASLALSLQDDGCDTQLRNTPQDRTLLFSALHTSSSPAQSPSHAPGSPCNIGRTALSWSAASTRTCTASSEKSSEEASSSLRTGSSIVQSPSREMR